ncbi:MAG: hypothetical protein NTZ35_01440 [Ignavibacteriales bacterium]|nr:hypothetical protein [Ignavibacteriales bacterium]
MNRELLRVVQKKYLEGERSISFSEIGKLGIKQTEKTVQIGNLRLKSNSFLEYYSVSLIDEEKDLDGLPIRENKKLFARLLTLWEEGKTRIYFDEMKKLNIYTPKSSFEIKNFRLSSVGPWRVDHYGISLIDEKKDPEGKWIDEMTNAKRVLAELESFEPSGDSYKKETALEKELFFFFRDRFHTVQRQLYIGGSVKALRIDFDIADGKIGLELKLAESLLDSTEKQRLIGQMHDYTTKRYKPENFILVIAGELRLRSDPTISEIRNLVKARSHLFFLSLD